MNLCHSNKILLIFRIEIFHNKIKLKHYKKNHISNTTKNVRKNQIPHKTTSIRHFIKISKSEIHSPQHQNITDFSRGHVPTPIENETTKRERIDIRWAIRAQIRKLSNYIHLKKKTEDAKRPWKDVAVPIAERLNCAIFPANVSFLRRECDLSIFWSHHVSWCRHHRVCSCPMTIYGAKVVTRRWLAWVKSHCSENSEK